MRLKDKELKLVVGMFYRMMDLYLTYEWCGEDHVSKFKSETELCKKIEKYLDEKEFLIKRGND